MSTKMATGLARFSFCNVFTPRRAQNGEEAKYGVTLLIPKEDKDTLRSIKEAMTAAKEAYMSRKDAKKLPSNLKHTLHDGDGERPSGGEFGPECKGHWVLTVNSKEPPKVVDRYRKDITDQREVYSGCYGRAVIDFYVYSNSGNTGITAQLLAVMKLKNGEPLSGKVVTDKDWGTFDYDSVEDISDDDFAKELLA